MAYHESGFGGFGAVSDTRRVRVTDREQGRESKEEEEDERGGSSSSPRGGSGSGEVEVDGVAGQNASARHQIDTSTTAGSDIFCKRKKINYS